MVATPELSPNCFLLHFGAKQLMLGWTLHSNCADNTHKLRSSSIAIIQKAYKYKKTWTKWSKITFSTSKSFYFSRHKQWNMLSNIGSSKCFSYHLNLCQLYPILLIKERTSIKMQGLQQQQLSEMEWKY
jgi:hypothetical protein